MTRKRLSDRQKNLVGARYLAGETQGAIAADLGVSARTVTNILAAAGIRATDRIAAPAAGPGSRTTPADPAAVSRYQALGGPRKPDALSSVEWLQGANVEAARQIMADGNYPGGELARRRELREQTKVVIACTPQTVLAEVRRLIQGDADKLTAPPGPEREDAPSIPSRAYRATAGRGRPRKF